MAPLQWSLHAPCLTSCPCSEPPNSSVAHSVRSKLLYLALRSHHHLAHSHHFPLDPYGPRSPQHLPSLLVSPEFHKLCLPAPVPPVTLAPFLEHAASCPQKGQPRAGSGSCSCPASSTGPAQVAAQCCVKAHSSRLTGHCDQFTSPSRSLADLLENDKTASASPTWLGLTDILLVNTRPSGWHTSALGRKSYLSLYWSF